MTRVGRLAGALLVETGSAHYLVGHLKAPCDFAAAGLARPDDLDTAAPRGVRLEALGPVRLAAPWLVLDVEGEAAVALLAARLVIERTGLVSERLWRLVTDTPEDALPGQLGQGGAEALDARWFGAMPAAVWQVVRDAVLRCA